MKKIFFNFFLILIFSTNLSFSNEISEVKIIGNKRISNETIIVLGDIDSRNVFTRNDLNNTLKKLYDTNFFSDIDITFENNILKIELVENPIIEKINITGIKKKSLIETLKDTMTLKDRMSYTEFEFNKNVNQIKNILKTSGYYFSNIKITKEENIEFNSVILNLDIDLGKKAKIKDIVFIGNKKFKDKRLLELIASEEYKFWKFITNKVYLNKSLVDLDKRLLENFYKNNGYYNVRVLNSFAELDGEEGYFKITFNIDSGKKYYFNEFNLNLPQDYNESDFDRINKIFVSLVNEEYSLDNIDLILNEIDEIASLQLYDFIKIDVQENIVDEDKINFNFFVKDSDKFYVEKINILGNFNTLEEVIRNKLIVDEGDPYNEILYNKSVNEIKSLGIFKKVDSEIIDGSNSNTKILNITVEEMPTGEISLGAGIGTTGGVLAGGLKEKNFMGKGVTLDSNFQISEEGVKGSITYAKPNFNYTDNTLFTSIKSTTQDSLSSSGYKITTAGFSIGTKFEQYENFFFSPELDFTQEDLTTNSTASKSFKKQEGSYSDFYFNYSLLYDTRDNPYNPSKGNTFIFNQEMPLISTDNEIKNTLRMTKYKPLNQSKDMIGKASFYFSAINSLDGSDVRISKRTRIPYNRLRGFEKGKIGPIDSGDYVGGNYSAAINFSSNLPGILSSFENLDFSYFIDVGNVWGVDYDSSLDDASKIRSSTGIALDFLTPIGPLSFSWSQPITKHSSDKTETFRFNLGTTF